MEISTFPSWRFDAVCHISVWQVRDGEVPRIR
jgi:hypothetical protein